MLSTFGAKAALAVLINALVVTLLFRRELRERAQPAGAHRRAAACPRAFVLRQRR